MTTLESLIARVEQAGEGSRELMKMREATIGQMVFRRETLQESAEVCETYYTRVSEDRVLHHGCIQGDPAPQDESERPRYVNFSRAGFEYPLINFPIHHMVASVFHSALRSRLATQGEG